MTVECDDPDFYPCDDCSEYIDTLMQQACASLASDMANRVLGEIASLTRLIPEDTQGSDRHAHALSMLSVIVTAFIIHHVKETHDARVLDRLRESVAESVAQMRKEIRDAQHLGKAAKGNAGSSPW